MVIEFGQLIKEQKQAIDSYSTGGYRAINNYLRTDPKPEWDMFGLEGLSKTIDSIFDLTPVRPNPSIVFRGTQNDNIYDRPVFTDKGYMSTSLEENIARKKEFLPPANGVLLKIHLQCSIINLLEIDGTINESEYLIPRNTRFRVLYRGEEINSETNQFVSFIGICPF